MKVVGSTNRGVHGDRYRRGGDSNLSRKLHTASRTRWFLGRQTLESAVIEGENRGTLRLIAPWNVAVGIGLTLPF